MKQSEKIINWIKNHPLISKRGLEAEAGLPPDTIKKALLGTRSLPEKHSDSIINIIKDYGYKKK